MFVLIIVYEFVDSNIVWVKEKLRNVNKFEVNHYEQKYDPKEYFENNVKVKRKEEEDGNKENENAEKKENADNAQNAENAESAKKAQNNKTENREERQIEREIIGNEVNEAHADNEVSEIPEVQNIHEIEENSSYKGAFFNINRKHKVDSDYKRYKLKKQKEEMEEKEILDIQRSIFRSGTVQQKISSNSNNKLVPKNVGAGGGKLSQRNSMKSATGVRRVYFGRDDSLFQMFSPQSEKKDMQIKKPVQRKKSLFQSSVKQEHWDNTSNKSEEDELPRPTRSKLLKRAVTVLADIKSTKEILKKSPIRQNYFFNDIKLEHKRPPKQFTKKETSFEFYKSSSREFNFSDKKMEKLKLNENENINSSKNISLVSFSDSASSKNIISMENALKKSNSKYELDQSLSENVLGNSGFDQELAKQNGKYCL